MAKSIRHRRYDDVMEVKYDSNFVLKTEKSEMKLPLSISDKKSIFLLTFLYVLQGIPLGLAGAVPYLLQSRQVSYAAQATFSFAFWPFSMKILWAPIVDCVYSQRIGRRKSWLIPAQLLISATMLIVSSSVDMWMSDGNIFGLTTAFFFLNFLAATQDVAVDGWALTMLSKSAVGWASTCNSVGQTTGYFTAFIVFLALESPEFCNTWLRTTPQSSGLVTFSGFIYFWGVIFLITTLLVLFFKHENDTAVKYVGVVTQNGASGDNDDVDEDDDDDDDESARLGIIGTYTTLWSIIKLRPVMCYIAILFCIKFGFSATDSMTGLKLMEKGVSKEKLAFIGSLVVPVQILLALLVSKYTTGTRPLNIFILSALPRYIYGLVFAALVYLTPTFQSEDGSYPFTYYVIITLGYASHQMFVYPMFVAVMAFYARISDPNIGGTYMTLLNTITNLAGNIPNTMMLYLVDIISQRSCVGGPNNGMKCSITTKLHGGSNENICGTNSACTTTFDGYYLLVIASTILGLIAITSFRRTLHWIQELPLSSWKVAI